MSTVVAIVLRLGVITKKAHPRIKIKGSPLLRASFLKIARRSGALLLLSYHHSYYQCAKEHAKYDRWCMKIF